TLSQITTFLTAGHATTASTIIWMLYALARAPVAQAQLRTMLRVCDKDDLYATLELPLLEHTVRTLYGTKPQASINLATENLRNGDT
ncbi:hypothetical protein BJY52DRAFT_1304643, partial [Lactarius psammicola]